VTTDQVLIGIGLILVLAVGSQVLASRLKIPALIILLPAGFTAGAITTDVNPQDLLGAAFQPLVSLAVAVILYDAGMSLDLRKLRGHTRRVVDRLIVLGVPVTFAFGAVFAGLLLGMSRQAALMTGAILVVSGPTVVGPLLTFIRPTERLQRVLAWEGSLIDPVGGILGAVCGHRLIRRVTATWTIRVGLLIEAGLHLTLATSRDAYVVGFMMFVFGVHAALWSIVAASLRQRMTPPEMLGRVSSTSLFISAGGNCIGALLGGTLAAVFGITAPYWAAFVVAVGVSATTWRVFDRATVARAYEEPALAEAAT